MAVAAGLTDVGSALADTTYTAIISDQLIRELRPMNVLRPFLREAPSTVGRSKSYDFTVLDAAGSGLAAATAPEEWMEDIAGTDAFTGASPDSAATYPGATDFATSRFTPFDMEANKVRVTAWVRGIAAVTNDFAKATSLLDIISELKGLMARTLAERWETDCASLFTSFARTAQAATSTLTSSDILSAIATLEQANITGPLVFVGHSKQAHEIRSDIQTKTGAYWGRADAKDSGSLHGYHRTAHVGDLFDVPIYQTNVVPTASSRHVGLLFTPKEAIGYISLWDSKVEMDRHIMGLTDEIVCSQSYGFVAMTQSAGMQSSGTGANERAIRITSVT